ncbi:MAG TPA: DUF2993 domain-containing protein [Candidatus Corynebacterium avicola]|uniref:DUF2993 domain-containing protein n=1 Tax=Candidatus Corynebacterium avicola TaxID=2838527 RepID=A0A9D1RP35_9CORY|nr:DUF2993 domain-containing protein [Candidatus Corynebacterium avicola]
MLVIVLVILVAVAAVGIVGDSLVAARVEKRISEKIYEESNLAAPPEVLVTGMPYTGAVLNHEVPSIHVEARDVEIPDFGRVTVSSSARKLTLGRDAVLTGDFRDAPAEEVFTRIQMDTVELGEHMGIDDLTLRSEDNSSPQGGWETEAFLAGTPEGEDGEYEVNLRLRVWQGDVYLTPTEITATPDGTDPETIDALDDDTREKVMDAFTLEFTSSSLPLRSAPRRVYTSGGSLFIEASEYFTKVSVSDLTPRSGPLGEDERAGL